MNGCNFRVSPQAFFQVNTPCAEILYSLVVEALQGSPPGSTADCAGETASDTTHPAQGVLCLDVCCGTGTIGICCAKANLGVVVGVELCQAAVDDAHLNAGLNGMRLLQSGSGNATDEAQTLSKETAGLAFVCSRAEAVLGSILSDRAVTSQGANQMLRDVTILARGKKVLAVVDPPREVSVDCCVLYND